MLLDQESYRHLGKLQTFLSFLHLSRKYIYIFFFYTTVLVKPAHLGKLYTIQPNVCGHLIFGSSDLNTFGMNWSVTAPQA